MPQSQANLCQEYLPYNEKDAGFVVCHTELDADGNCHKVHASTRDVAERFVQWGYKRGLTGVWALLEMNIPVSQLKSHIEKIIV